MSKTTSSGKGSAPRKQQDHDAYSSGWDRIFKKKDFSHLDKKDYCHECGEKWEDHDFGVPSPYCPKK